MDKTRANESLLILLGDQLFPIDYIRQTGCRRVFMAEDFGLCRQNKHHKLKILMFFTAMRAYRDELQRQGFEVCYHAADTDDFAHTFEEKLDRIIVSNEIREIHHFEIDDHFFSERIRRFLSASELKRCEHPSQKFLCSANRFSQFSNDKKTLRMASFYQMMRKDLKVLIDDNQKPVGGKWSFDEENRKKLPRGIALPDKPKFTCDSDEALVQKIEEHFPDHPGTISGLWMPITREHALSRLDEFLHFKFKDFGRYEDAIHSEDQFLFHSALSTSMNMGLLTPKEVVEKAIDFSERNDVPINSIEGFLRQVIGWREFIHGVYDTKRESQVKSNFWKHRGELTSHWYKGTTGIAPLDDVIKDCNQYAYTHHIPRLMIVANLMTLSRVHPDQVFNWFMEMFVDSADWVMVPNVYGMGTFADGGFFSTKPYICGSNYILKMSNYKRGPWCDLVDGLYWLFIQDNLEFFKGNPRLSIMTRALNKLDPKRKAEIFELAREFISTKVVS